MRFVAPAIDKYINSVTDEREPDGKYHPSSMFGCDRQVMYGLRGVEKSEELDSASKRRFYIGHRLHEVVQRALESAPELAYCYSEFEVDIPELNIKGHGDVLVGFADGTWAIVEVKSTKRAAVRWGLPKEDHKKQAKMYAVAVRKYGCRAYDESIGAWITLPPLGEDLKGVVIVYLEKEQLDVHENWLPWDDKWVDDVADRLIELNVYAEDPDSLPPRLPLKKDGKKQWPCDYCPWYDKCWNKDPREILPKEVF